MRTAASDWVPKLAKTVAEVDALTEEVLTVNAAEVLPAGIVTVFGTVAAP